MKYSVYQWAIYIFILLFLVMIRDLQMAVLTPFSKNSPVLYNVHCPTSGSLKQTQFFISPFSLSEIKLVK